MTDLALPRPGPAREPLAAALTEAGYTDEGWRGLLGPVAAAALERGERVPALRATRSRAEDPAALALRLFLLGAAVPAPVAAAALPLDACLADGWLRECGDGTVRATVDVRPWAGGYVVSDRGTGIGGALGRREPGAVLGVGGATSTLAGLAMPGTPRRALDLGTGSGALAVTLAARSGEVVATDVNPRALRCAELSLALSGARNARVVEGSLYEPVRGGFDLIVSNPPFVISPAGRFAYRDAGLHGDDLCRRVVAGAPARLAPGGVCQLLANWQHVAGQDWRERVSDWLAGSGCDAWVMQRDVQDVARYAELWLRDGGDDPVSDPEGYRRRYDDWLTAFERDRVEAVGFGWITLRRTDAARPRLTIEEWPHPVEQPLGPAIAGRFDRLATVRAMGDAELLASRLRAAEDLSLEQHGPVGAEDPEYLVLRQSRGLRRARTVGTVPAGLVGACDGQLTVEAILDALATLLDRAPSDLRDATLPEVRDLIVDGFLVF